MEKSLKKNAVYNALKTCSAIVFPLITFPYASRVLLPENVGKVNFANSFVSYFSLVASLGIGTYAVRECAAVRNDRNKLNNIASQIYSINILSMIVSYALLFITIIFFRKLDVYRELILIESATVVLTVVGADWLNSAMEDLKYITIRTVSAQLIAIICMFIFVRDKDDYVYYTIILVFSTCGASILNIWYRRRYCTIKFTLKIDWRTHIGPIVFLFVMMLSQTLFNNTDVTMLGLMKGDYEVGQYSTAMKVMRLISQIVSSLALVIIPRLSVYYSKNDFKSLNTLLRKVLSYNITIGLPIVVGAEMMADDIVYIVGGSDYIEAAPILRVLILSFLFSLVGGSFLGNAILIPMQQEKYYMLVCLVTAVLNVGLNFILIPIIGAIGASIATAINGFLIFVLLLVKIDKRIKIERKARVFIDPLIGCGVIVLVCFLCSFISGWLLRVICSVTLSVIGYGVVLFVLKNDFVMSIMSRFYGRKTK